MDLVLLSYYYCNWKPSKITGLEIGLQQYCSKVANHSFVQQRRSCGFSSWSLFKTAHTQWRYIHQQLFCNNDRKPFFFLRKTALHVFLESPYLFYLSKTSLDINEGLHYSSLRILRTSERLSFLTCHRGNPDIFCSACTLTDGHSNSNMSLLAHLPIVRA